jgi:hypothetical protein
MGAKDYKFDRSLTIDKFYEELGIANSRHNDLRDETQNSLKALFRQSEAVEVAISQIWREVSEIRTRLKNRVKDMSKLYNNGKAYYELETDEIHILFYDKLRRCYTWEAETYSYDLSTTKDQLRRELDELASAMVIEYIGEI